MPTIQLFYETKQIDLTTANTVYHLRDLRGGEVMLIKAKNANAAVIYIGDENVSTSNGFELGAGQTLKIRVGKEVSPDKHLRIYAVSGTAGTDVTYMMIPYFVEVQAGD